MIIGCSHSAVDGDFPRCNRVFSRDTRCDQSCEIMMNKVWDMTMAVDDPLNLS